MSKSTARPRRHSLIGRARCCARAGAASGADAACGPAPSGARAAAALGAGGGHVPARVRCCSRSANGPMSIGAGAIAESAVAHLPLVHCALAAGLGREGGVVWQVRAPRAVLGRPGRGHVGDRWAPRTKGVLPEPALRPVPARRRGRRRSRRHARDHLRLGGRGRGTGSSSRSPRSRARSVRSSSRTRSAARRASGARRARSFSRA